MTDPHPEPHELPLAERDVSPTLARDLLRRARVAQQGDDHPALAFFSRVLVPVGLAGTAVLYLQWALQHAFHP